MLPPAKPHSKQPAHTDCSFIQKPLYWDFLPETWGVKSVPQKVNRESPRPEGRRLATQNFAAHDTLRIFWAIFFATKDTRYGVQKCKETKIKPGFRFQSFD